MGANFSPVADLSLKADLCLSNHRTSGHMGFIDVHIWQGQA